MYIYKITNKINNKLYIGQTSKSIEYRYKLHIANSKKKSIRKKQPIDAAIYKYGVENFIVEQIDIASTKEELSFKEKYWISFYDSTNKNKGYNLTSGGEGGNTYALKSSEEMNMIKNIISIKNTGRSNGIARPIKMTNIYSGEVKIMESMRETKDFLGLKGHYSILSRCRGYLKPYKGWIIEWENDNYHNYNQGVSTIPDECKGVELEMGTNSKRKAKEEPLKI